MPSKYSNPSAHSIQSGWKLLCFYGISPELKGDICFYLDLNHISSSTRDNIDVYIGVSVIVSGVHNFPLNDWWLFIKLVGIHHWNKLYC